MVWLAYGTHVFPLQQPFGHDVASHVQAPAVEQLCPDAQLLQATPPLPQVVFDSVLHWPLLSQQPLGHEVASHTQLVPLQR